MNLIRLLVISMKRFTRVIVYNKYSKRFTLSKELQQLCFLSVTRFEISLTSSMEIQMKTDDPKFIITDKS